MRAGAAALLLPAFALLLKLLYPGRRRYPSRPRLYGEHLVFAAHSHAFVFLAGTALVPAPIALVQPVIGAWIVIYLFLALRAVYGGSWLGSVARSVAMVVVYAILFGRATAGLLVAAVLLR